MDALAEGSRSLCSPVCSSLLILLGSTLCFLFDCRDFFCELSNFVNCSSLIDCSKLSSFWLVCCYSLLILLLPIVFWLDFGFSMLFSFEETLATELMVLLISVLCWDTLTPSLFISCFKGLPIFSFDAFILITDSWVICFLSRDPLKYSNSCYFCSWSFFILFLNSSFRRVVCRRDFDCSSLLGSSIC